MLFTTTLLLGMFPSNAPVSPPQVHLNEVDSDTEGFDMLEFVELYDGGNGNTPLDGLVVVFYNGGDDASYNAAFDLDGFSTDAGGYFLIGNAAVVPTPQIIIPSNGLQNGADAVALYIGDGASFPNDTPVTTANLIDGLVYDTNEVDDAGLAVLDINNYGQINEDENGNSNFVSIQVCPPNAITFLGTSALVSIATPTPGAENSCTSPEPVNDDCENAIPAVEGPNALDSTTATDPVQPFPCADGGHDLWYTFQASRNANYTFSMCGSFFDTVIAVYEGDCGGELALFGCNDDECGFQSELTAELESGATYLVQVGGFGDSTGAGTLTITKSEGALNYCDSSANSVGSGASMGSSGSTDVSSDDFVLECSGLPPEESYVFTVGMDKAGVPLFNGVQCVFQPCRLYPPAVSTAGGMASRALTQAEYVAAGCTPPIAGSQFYFQCFYRDTGVGTGANLSDGLAVVFGPGG